MFGSFHDAEDVLQQTRVPACRGLSAFEGRSSIPAWLYRVATSRCLNPLRSARSRVREEVLMQPTELPSQRGAVDRALSGCAHRSRCRCSPGPEARYETTEAVSLAFIITLQLLPPHQRAVHILAMCSTSIPTKSRRCSTQPKNWSTGSSGRGQRYVSRYLNGVRQMGHHPRTRPTSGALVERFTQAFQSDDIEAVVALLAEDVCIRMPPVPFEWQGHERARAVLRAVLEPGRHPGGNTRERTTSVRGVPAGSPWTGSASDWTARARASGRSHFGNHPLREQPALAVRFAA